MYPPSVALKDELGKLDAPLLLHLLYEFEQTAMVSTVTSNDISSAAEQVVAVLHTPDELVELLAAVSTADHYRLSPRFAYRVEELVY